jgi:hypothetical protein
MIALCRKRCDTKQGRQACLKAAGLYECVYLCVYVYVCVRVCVRVRENWDLGHSAVCNSNICEVCMRVQRGHQGQQVQQARRRI